MPSFSRPLPLIQPSFTHPRVDREHSGHAESYRKSHRSDTRTKYENSAPESTGMCEAKSILDVSDSNALAIDEHANHVESVGLLRPTMPRDPNLGRLC